jgi:hypothetical protein
LTGADEDDDAPVGVVVIGRFIGDCGGTIARPGRVAGGAGGGGLIVPDKLELADSRPISAGRGGGAGN